jgi:uncharacterized protein
MMLPLPSKSEAVLLDANVLIAISVSDHEHHRRSREWLGRSRRFATCPSTQGSLVRYLVRVATTDHALEVLRLLTASDRHEFWPDDAPFDAATLANVIGHRQVTDAYLARTAHRRHTRVATLDQGLALLRPQDALLIP